MAESRDSHDLPTPAGTGWHAGPLPTFDEMRREAYRLLTDAGTVLRSDWRASTNPADDEVNALYDAEEAVNAAITALRRAGPVTGTPGPA